MVNNEKSSVTNGRHRIVVIALLALCACGILVLSWKDIYAPIPAFAELREAKANGFRPDIAREIWSPEESSIELYDDAGRRYQIRGVTKVVLNQITSALQAERPVVIRYGRWRSPFPSSTIFSVYQVEVDGRILIPYSDLAHARQREQADGPLIILCTSLLAGIAVFFALRRERKFRRQLALIRHNNADKS